MSLSARSFEEPPSGRLASLPPGFAASIKSRAHYRPPPILLVEGKAADVSNSPSRFKVSTPSSASCRNWANRSKSPVESLDSPAFIGGDLSFSTFRSRAARAIAEWGPSPTCANFGLSDVSSPQRSHRFGTESGYSHAFDGAATDSVPLEPSNTLLLPGLLRHSQLLALNSPPSTPFTPLTPGPCNSPQHREVSRNQRPPSLKARKVRPRPSPLQLSPRGDQTNDPDIVRKLRSVRFADGSPIRGSTWHLTQYPERLASPPISAANLSLADLVELESIKQSLGTWCGEMMGSPMRVTFSQNSSCSEQDSASEFPSSTSFKPAVMISSPTSSDIDWQARWPISPAFSDCDSEIFEGMH